jgi:ribosomal protein S2
MIRKMGSKYLHLWNVNGIHIINLYKTAAKIEEANSLKKIAASGEKYYS